MFRFDPGDNSLVLLKRLSCGIKHLYRRDVCPLFDSCYELFI